MPIEATIAMMTMRKQILERLVDSYTDSPSIAGLAKKTVLWTKLTTRAIKAIKPIHTCPLRVARNLSLARNHMSLVSFFEICIS